MLVDDDRSKDANPEFREWWEKNTIPIEVATRAQELADQGRWGERGEVITNYILSREDWIQQIRESREAYKRGEVKFRTPPHDPSA